MRFGKKHSLRRILHLPRVEWTLCAMNGYLCAHHADVVPWEPGLPICCAAFSTATLFKLIDTVEAYREPYLVMQGSILGSFRNGRSVPWSFDHDIAISVAAHERLVTNAAFLPPHGAYRYRADKNKVVSARTPFSIMPRNSTLAHWSPRMQSVIRVLGDPAGSERLAHNSPHRGKDYAAYITWRTATYIDVSLRKRAFFAGSPTTMLNGRRIQILQHPEQHLVERYGRDWKRMPPGFTGLDWCFLTDNGTPRAAVISRGTAGHCPAPPLAAQTK
jgi:hypothetical protein